MTKPSFKTILDALRPDLEPMRDKSTNLSPESQLALFLTFVRSGGVHRLVGQHYLYQVSAACVTRVVNKIALLLAGMRSKVLEDDS